MKLLLKQKNVTGISLVIIALFLGFNIAHAQQRTIQGLVTDLQSESPISYASVTLHTKTDSTIITGTVSNDLGRFEISSPSKGDYLLCVSFVGYKTQMKTISVANSLTYDIGKISLSQESINIQEAVVIGERIKAKSTNEKTTFFVNKKMYDVSNTGVDILKQLPGVHVDLMQNITLEGSGDIIILVNGKECDVDFVQQINASQIDKIEVVRSPGSKYDSNITGVLNIILKERNFGVSGHVNAQIPTTDNELFLNPSYSLRYGNKRFNIYTSYNGEFNYFNITERNTRELTTESGLKTLTTDAVMRQKTWKHRFHYGVDFFMNTNNQFSFYGFYNPYSQEFDGDILMQSTLDGQDSGFNKVKREDTDKNHQAYSSLYYKHLFGSKGAELTIDINYYNLKADNTVYLDYSHDKDVVNRQKPIQHLTNLKIDFTTPLINNLRLDAGIKSYLKTIKQRHLPLFYNKQNANSGYLAFSYNYARFNITSGLRVENSVIKQNEVSSHNYFAFLPSARINLQITKKQKLQFYYRRTIKQPNVYQLNPAVSVIDLYSINRGNSSLKPSYKHILSLDYTIFLGNNYLSTQLFYTNATNVIQNLSFVNNNDLFETRIENLGRQSKYGIKWSGAIKLGNNIAIAPYFELVKSYNSPNNLAKQYQIADKESWHYESGFSASVGFKHQISASVNFQYNSPTYDLQNRRYSDCLYFVYFDKSFKNGMKIGLSTAIPFVKKFTSFGMETKGHNFYSNTQFDINISTLPIGLHFHYKFNKGKKVKTINRDKSTDENITKKGF